MRNRDSFWPIMALLVISSASAEAWPQSDFTRPPAGSASRIPEGVSFGIGLSWGPACAASRGVCVTWVRPGGAADRGGLKVGDVVRRLGDTEIVSPADIAETLRTVRVGDTVLVVLERQGAETSLPVRFTAADAASLSKNAPSQGKNGLGDWPAGASLQAPVADLNMPYERLPLPVEADALIEKVRDRDTSVWVSGDVLSIVHRDPRDPLNIVGSFQLPLARIPGTDVFVLQLRMNGWDKAFFSYWFYSPAAPGPAPGAAAYFRGANAPHLPAAAQTLRGRLVETSLHSVHLNETRAVTVYMPSGVRKGKLPALFMADGQSCGEYARVLEPLMDSGRVAPFAIIGVHSASVATQSGNSYDPSLDRRSQEYIPVMKPELAAKHMRFFIEEVLPWAIREYGISTDRADRAVFGSSSGAAFATSVAIQHADLFAHALPFSLGFLPVSSIHPTPVPQFYFAAGNLEPAFADSTKKMHELVRSWGANSRLALYTSGHDDLLWQVALASFVPSVFPPQNRDASEARLRDASR